MTTDTDAGLDLTRAEFERACSLLPPDFAWGWPVTPRLVLEVANALAPIPSAQEEAVRVPSYPQPGTSEYGSLINKAKQATDGKLSFHRDPFKYLCQFEQELRKFAAPAASAGDQEVGS